MAITNYTELKQAVKDWSHRSDLDTKIPDFVSLADARINRVLATREHEIETSLSMTPGSRYVALPSNFNYPVGLWLTVWLPRQKLMQMLPTELPVRTNVSGYPEYWAIDGTNIAFDKLASAAHTFDIRYVADKILSDTNPTNYVLTNYPDVYLWGSLAELAGYIRDAESEAKWDARYKQAMSDAQDNENSSRERAPLTTELSTVVKTGRFNIYRGY